LRLKNRGGFLETRLAAGCLFLNRFHFLQDQIEAHLEFRCQTGGFVVAQCPGFNQFSLVKLRDGGAFLDSCVEIGLGK
jgi:hypothetical protein